MGSENGDSKNGAGRWFNASYSQLSIGVQSGDTVFDS